MHSRMTALPLLGLMATATAQTGWASLHLPGLVTATPAEQGGLEPPVGELFAKGRWTFQTYGSATVGDSDKGETFTAHVGLGYFIADNVSINLDGVGGWVTPELDDDGGVGGFDLLGRRQFVRRPRWTFYLDGGRGFSRLRPTFPAIVTTISPLRGARGHGGTVRPAPVHGWCSLYSRVQRRYHGCE